MTLYVLVPKPDTSAAQRIDPGSAIVTDDGPNAPVFRVYYEGNRYGAANLQTFPEKAQCATGRLLEQYPTVACGTFHALDFEVVGTFHWRGPVAVSPFRLYAGGHDAWTRWVGLAEAARYPYVQQEVR